MRLTKVLHGPEHLFGKMAVNCKVPSALWPMFVVATWAGFFLLRPDFNPGVETVLFFMARYMALAGMQWWAMSSLLPPTRINTKGVSKKLKK